MYFKAIVIVRLSKGATCNVRKTEEQTVETKESCRNVREREKIRKTKKKKVSIEKGMITMINREERKSKDIARKEKDQAKMKLEIDNCK